MAKDLTVKPWVTTTIWSSGYFAQVGQVGVGGIDGPLLQARFVGKGLPVPDKVECGHAGPPLFLDFLFLFSLQRNIIPKLKLC